MYVCVLGVAEGLKNFKGGLPGQHTVDTLFKVSVHRIGLKGA